MNRSHDIIRMLERAPLEHQGEQLRVRFVSMRGRPEPPLQPMAVTITVETRFRGEPYAANVTFELERVAVVGDEQYVVDHLVEALRQVVAGELPPGAVNYL